MSENRFVVDLASCTGCQACRIACKDRAGLPDHLDWLRIQADEEGHYPRPTLTYRVVHCFHCQDAPCMEACPVSAIVESEQGRIQIESSLCIGCEACVETCPFGAIVMAPQQPSQGRPAPDVATKCDGCGDEVAKGWDPNCVRACPMRALYHEPSAPSNLGRRVVDREFDNHGIKPRVLYLRRPPVTD